MAIKIQTQKPEIPIEIGALTFGFDVSDESVEAFRKNAQKIQKELEGIESELTDDNALEATKDVLRRGYDLMLGKGAFDQIYEQTPSVMVVMNYFIQIAEGIEQELKALGYVQSQQQKAKKYIQSKKKK